MIGIELGFIVFVDKDRVLILVMLNIEYGLKRGLIFVLWGWLIYYIVYLLNVCCLIYDLEIYYK